MRASFELITFYMARRLLGVVARILARMPSQRSQDAAGVTETTMGTYSLTGTKPGPHRAE